MFGKYWTSRSFVYNRAMKISKHQAPFLAFLFLAFSLGFYGLVSFSHLSLSESDASEGPVHFFVKNLTDHKHFPAVAEGDVLSLRVMIPTYPQHAFELCRFTKPSVASDGCTKDPSFVTSSTGRWEGTVSTTGVSGGVTRYAKLTTDDGVLTSSSIMYKVGPPMPSSSPSIRPSPRPTTSIRPSPRR